MLLEHSIVPHSRHEAEVSIEVLRIVEEVLSDNLTAPVTEHFVQ
jgi:hypothetical protein